jgi:molybdopterin converting factor small subunit
MKVYIPTPLRSYTHTSIVDANGATLAELLIDLDRQFPGLRFRIVNEQDELREHIKLFVDQRIAQTLDEPLKPNDVVRIIMAISGGASARKP